MSLAKFSALIPVLLMLGCNNDDLVNIKLQQSIALQNYTSGFAAACKGKLSMESEYTGDMKSPAITKISCDDMDKSSDFFTPFNDQEIEELKKQIQDINN